MILKYLPGSYMIGYGMGKGNLKILPFCHFNEEYKELEKFKVILGFQATEMCLFLFSFEFSALEVPQFKIQKSSNFKLYFSYPIIYNPGHNQTYKSRRIVISYGFCIAKCFQNWVGLHNLIF